MKEISMITEIAKELADKRSWIKKGLEDFFQQINGKEKAKRIVGDFCVKIEFKTIKYYYHPFQDELDERLFLSFNTRDGGSFYLAREIWDPYFFKTEKVDISELPCDKVRKIVIELPSIFERMVGEMKYENKEWEDTKILLQKLLEAVKKV